MKIIVTDIADINFKINGDYKVIRPKDSIHNCIGCFACWVKTPGKCMIKDGYETIGSDMGKCDELIFISKCCYGSVSPFVKIVQDRALSYIHPYFEIRNGEMHHKRRYQNVITVSAYFYGEDIIEKDKETAKAILQANVDNYDGKLGEIRFLKNEKELEEIIL